MATTASAALTIDAQGTMTATSPYAGDVRANCTDVERWTDGDSSGQISRILYRSETMASGETDTYNLLAAGSLTDVYGQAIDADEIKGLVLRCITGSVSLKAPAFNFLTCFGAAGDKIILAAGHTIAINFGAGGLALSTSASLAVAEEAAAAATYELWLCVAQ